ncbi:MAG: DUF1080 domain-containing protein [Phycisphaerae bacterium]|jgi:hypothetical protein|nr:DUF1080 domain-containing protein [Phycisphaerae bacterium]
MLRIVGCLVGAVCACGSVLGAEKKTLIAHGGTWTVRDKAVWSDGGPGPKLVATGTDFADGQAGVEVYFDDKQGGNAALIVHVSQAGVGANNFIGYEIALDPQRQVLRFGRHKNNFSLMKDIKAPVPLKRWIPLVVRIKGGLIEVDVDGKQIASMKDAKGFLPAGAVGLRPWTRKAGFRNLWVSQKGKKRTIEFHQELIGGSPAAPTKRKTKPKPAPTISTAEQLAAVAALKAKLIKAVPRLVFVKRHHFKRPFGIGSIIGWNIFIPGGGIYTRDLTKTGPSAETELFRNDDGIIYDMSLSFDAKKILFAWRDCKKGESFHIYEIGADGKGLRQITSGRFHDIHPFYLPDGKIGFVTSRVEAFTMCQPGAACALYVMDADGKNMRRIHFGTLADHSPYVQDDGRILFTRWEYQDKNLTYSQSLWTINPDGTRLRLFYGNTIYEPAVTWQAKGIPGKSTVLCTLAPHHGNPIGAIGVIDRSKGLENPLAIRNITPDVPYRPDLNRSGYGDRQYPRSYRDPHPISGDLYLASHQSAGRFGVVALDNKGAKAAIVRDDKFSCFNALPLAPRKLPLRKPMLPPSDSKFGTFIITNVYEGLTGVKPGQVKAIRVMRVYPKPCNMRGRRAYDMDPLQSRATYYSKQCVGTVPVDAAGTASFKAPAEVELYFQALDASGKELQRMGTITQIMPGETQSCIGCHESAFMAPPSGAAFSKLLRRKPVDITPPPWGDGPIDFVRHIQPVFDKYCIKCHSGADPKKGLDLSGDKTRYFNMAYDSLLDRKMVQYHWLLKAPVRNWAPLTTGSRVSKLIKYIDQKHEKVVVDDESRRRIYTWIDANVPYYGTYEHTRPGTAGSRDLWTGPWVGQLRNALKAAGRNPGFGLTDVNLTRPEFSRVLTTALAKSAGGIADDKKAPFKSKSDPKYVAILKAIQAGKKALDANPRIDMPGAKPKPYPKDYGKLYSGFAGP